ncbi:MAG: spore coat protein CotJB [Oscillospiraceae bacterium]|nr:spore coat protein CotJB [Oscillospiraceae bacterium]
MDLESMMRPCDDAQGKLPPCAPLAVPYVPVQQTGSKRYNQMDALASGTLYPALNLPFHLKVAPSSLAESAVLELQALQFVLTELGLYLDTHPDDKEAFSLFQQYARMATEGKRRYEAAHGPLTQKSAADFDRYVWLDSPWPWEYEKEVAR